MRSFSAPTDFSLQKMNKVMRLSEDLQGKQRPEIALYWACVFGFLDVVTVLVNERFTDVNSTEFWCGKTPLMAACGNQRLEVVQFLLKAGANPNMADDLGRTPLMKASFTGHLGCVEELLKAGATVGHKKWLATVSKKNIVMKLLEASLKETKGQVGHAGGVEHKVPSSLSLFSSALSMLFVSKSQTEGQAKQHPLSAATAHSQSKLGF
jgi:ankyrin repeat protein